MKQKSKKKREIFPFKSNTRQLLILLLLFAAIPLTVLMTQQVNDVRQRAAEVDTIKCLQSALPDNAGQPKITHNTKDKNTSLVYWNYSIEKIKLQEIAKKCNVQLLKAGNFNEADLQYLVDETSYDTRRKGFPDMGWVPEGGNGDQSDDSSSNDIVPPSIAQYKNILLEETCTDEHVKQYATEGYTVAPYVTCNPPKGDINYELVYRLLARKNGIYPEGGPAGSDPMQQALGRPDYASPVGVGSIFGNSGQIVVVAPFSSEPPQNKTVTLTVTPQEVPQGNTVQATWNFNGIEAASTDLLVVYKEKPFVKKGTIEPDNSKTDTISDDAFQGVNTDDSEASARVYAMYTSSCKENPANNTRADGHCLFSTAGLTPGLYTFRLFSKDTFEQRLTYAYFWVVKNTSLVITPPAVTGPVVVTRPPIVTIVPVVTTAPPRERACTSNADCQAPDECARWQNYPGRCMSPWSGCAQIIVNACNQNNPSECAEFPNPCYVPPGWKVKN